MSSFLPPISLIFAQTTNMGRVLAIDYGTKRVGLAVTDPLQLIANTLTTVEEKQVIGYLKEYFAKEDVSTIVLGKPSRMDGSETHASQPVEKFLLLLRQTFPTIPVVQIDERFTSLIAKRTLVDMGMKKKDRQNKENLDQVSAAIILQTYLEMK